ncbi:MAG: potassium channel family protein [Acidobacteriia bacterium]|nr:potassium channel family protein [Terriglobia bacterium]
MTLRKRLLFAVGLLAVLITVSVTGYRVLGGSSVTFLQALYMAVITLAGVGYGEIVDTSHNAALRVFNIGIVLFGVAITVYVFSVVAAFLVEVEVTNPFWRRRMQKRIDELRDHFIVCGLGDTGRHAVAELQKTGTPHVVVDISEEKIKKLRELHPESLSDVLYVAGDATEEEVLEKAGLERARGLITVLPNDKDNLVVTVVVRQHFPKMRIVTRSADHKFAERMMRAGANATVSPSQIGGLRMASELIRPHVVGFLDLMLKEKGSTLRVEEIEVHASSAWAGVALHDLNLKGRYNLLVLGLKKPRETEGPELVANPPDNSVVPGQGVIIAMGDLKDIQRARSDALA